MIIKSNHTHLDVGLLIIRIVVGGLIAFHGAGIVVNGQEAWTMIGEMGLPWVGMNHITGLIAGLILLIGGVFVVLGMWRKIGTGLISIIMLTATIAHIRRGHPIMGAGPTARHAIDSLAIFVGLYLTGPGKYAICKKCVGYTHAACCGSPVHGVTQQQ